MSKCTLEDGIKQVRLVTVLNGRETGKFRECYKACAVLIGSSGQILLKIQLVYFMDLYNLVPHIFCQVNTTAK